MDTKGLFINTKPSVFFPLLVFSFISIFSYVLLKGGGLKTVFGWSERFSRQLKPVTAADTTKRKFRPDSNNIEVLVL